jgi:hypothetical protein
MSSWHSVYKIWEPRCLTTLWAFTACYRYNFFFFSFSERISPFALPYNKRLYCIVASTSHDRASAILPLMILWNYQLWKFGGPEWLDILTKLTFFFKLPGSDFGYCGHNWPIVPTPDDRWWWLWRNWWYEDWRGKPKYSEKTCPSATLSTTNPTWLDLGFNHGRRGGKPATNRLSYGTAARCSLLGPTVSVSWYLWWTYGWTPENNFSGWINISWTRRGPSHGVILPLTAFKINNRKVNFSVGLHSSLIYTDLQNQILWGSVDCLGATGLRMRTIIQSLPL